MMSQTAGEIALLLPECSICMEIIQDARLLSCGHTFCGKCLQGHANQSPIPGNVIECPECRRQIVLPKDGVSGLPRNYSLQATIDRLQGMSLAQGAAPVMAAAEEQKKPLPAARKYTAKCKKHSTEVTNFCCETCNGALICRDCTVVDHRGHLFVNIKDKSDQLKASLTTLIGQHQKMTESVLAVNQKAAVSTIRSHIWHLQSEAQGASDRMIQEIETQQEQFKSQVQQLGCKLEEKVDLMYYNQRPIDDIVGMIGRGNEYEITEKFAKAQECLQVSLSEMQDKMDAKLMPSVARSLSLKINKNMRMNGKSEMFEVILTSLSWKLASKVIVNTAGCQNTTVTSFTCVPNGNWYVLYTSKQHQNAVVVKELSKVGSERLLSLQIEGKPVDIKSTEDSSLVIPSIQSGTWCLNLYDTTGRATLCKELPIKRGRSAVDLYVHMDSEHQLWIPETNGHTIWMFNPSDRFVEHTFSVNGFFHPINVALSGSHLYYITSKKKVMKRPTIQDGIPEPCKIDTKLGDPAQLLVDPITCEVLIVYHRLSEPGRFELSIHQLESSKPLVDPILLDWVPSAKKVEISRKGNLAILLATGQGGIILDYDREHLPALSDILSNTPQ
ncbi:E3 ubiquitin-protein ligase TRIM71 [Strongylocentrotus purpuratus]|uniref:RING-type domain-containing protein n=1 Tax=Strongylocentrotus purpuratus TaxID=7668 RepID=A0A7M7HIQ8_STRPU|nr:E3 ubiquitin-protein ligase TRIM71 [Strongylocentrotus purpuratus]